MDVSGHKCSKQCIEQERRKIEEKGAEYVILTDGVLSKRGSPFSVPLDFGWNRSEYGYTTPCGRKRYTLSAIQRFLSRSGSRLSIDQFNLDLDFNLFLTEKNFNDSRIVTPDIANGSENLPIPCINDIDDQDMDPLFVYSPHRLAIGGVDMNVGIVSGCSCSDRCVNRLSCHCRLLTEEADDLADVCLDSEQFGGYEEKLLTKVYVPGMYECNDRCSCGPRCQNRVSQEGIRAHLQVFRIPEKGWGLRCLHDLPAGYFICLYSGQVMTNSHADEIGPERGDEYFVSLNLIEMVEQKVGYESESGPSSLSTQSEDSILSSVLSDESGDSLTPDSSRGDKRQRSEDEEVVSRKRTKKNSGEEGSDPKEGFVKVRRHLAESVRGLSETSSDSDDAGFVIDAKRQGNAGRFLNHSCYPNCQLQNIFTDSHDPRFPVLAFFTMRKVPALEELTWNYLYDEGVHVFQCQCGSSACKYRAQEHDGQSIPPVT